MKFIYTTFLFCLGTISSYAIIGPITGPSTVCIGSNITLSDTTLGGTWSSNSVSVAQVGYTSGIVTGISAGIVNLTYTKSGSYVVKTIIVNPYSFPITGSSALCVGANITLHDSIGGGSWSATNANASVSPTGIISGFAAGIDTIIYSVAYSCGNAVSTKVITVNPIPDAGSIVGNSYICVGAKDTLTNITTGGTWTSSSAAKATITSYGEIKGIASGFATITYSVSVLGCSNFTTKNITVNALPVIGVVSGLASVCIGNSITLSDTTTGGIWSTSNTNAAVSGTGIVTGNVAGNDTVIYSKTTVCGTFSKTKSIIVRPLPNAGTISSPASYLCVNDTFRVTTTSTGGAWSKTNASASITSAGLVKGVKKGIDTITYTVNSTFGCGTDIARKVITINPLPVVTNITGPYSVCKGSTITLIDTSNGGIWSHKNANSTITSSGILTGIAEGNDTVVYTVENGCGSVFKTKTISIYPLPFAGSITPSTECSVCTGSTVTLTSSVTGGAWSVCNANASISSGRVKGLIPGNDTVRYIITSTHGCGKDTALKAVTINQSPEAGKITGESAICVGNIITLTETMSGGVWNKSNANVKVINGVVTGLSEGSVTIYYVVTSQYCGNDTAKHNLTIASAVDCPAGFSNLNNPSNSAMLLYPNPANGNFINIEINNPTQNISFEVFNLIGQKVISQLLTQNTTQIDISNLPNGCYLVACYKDGIKIDASRFIKE